MPVHGADRLYIGDQLIVGGECVPDSEIFYVTGNVSEVFTLKARPIKVLYEFNSYHGTSRSHTGSHIKNETSGVLLWTYRGDGSNYSYSQNRLNFSDNNNNKVYVSGSNDGAGSTGTRDTKIEFTETGCSYYIGGVLKLTTTAFNSNIIDIFNGYTTFGVNVGTEGSSYLNGQAKITVYYR